MWLKALLLDLDGTLIRYELDSFLERYLRALASKVARYIEPEPFIHSIMASTYAMIGNLDGSKTNKEIFMEDFFSRVDVAPEVLLPLFEEFYARDYPLLGGCVRPDPAARKVIGCALGLGLDVVIATNPVFPMQAVRERLRWGRIADFDYRLITSYEIMHYCKPNREYFEEVLAFIGRRPEECLMVGNDVDEDLPAGKVGIRTFLVEDSIINRRGITPKPHYRGRLRELLPLIQEAAGDSGQRM